MLNKRIFTLGMLLTLAASGIAIGQSTTRRTKAKPKTSTARTQSKPPSSVTIKRPAEPFFDTYETGENVRATDATRSSNALPEPDDEVLTRTGQTQAPKNSPAAIDPRTGKPFQTGSGDGQSIRRKQPARPSVNTDRPTEEVGVENPNAQPTKNATTRPKIKRNPNAADTDKPKLESDAPAAGQAFTGYLKIEGVKAPDREPDTGQIQAPGNGYQTNSSRRSATPQTQRPPNGPVGKPKRVPIKRITREPIENPIKVTPPSSEWDVDNPDEVTGRRKKPTQDKLGNFEIQGVKRPTTLAECTSQLDQQITRTKLTPPNPKPSGISECQQQLDWIAAARGSSTQQNRDMEITMANDGKTPAAARTETVNNNNETRRPAKASAQARDAAPTEEVRLERRAAPKRKPAAARRTLRKPN